MRRVSPTVAAAVVIGVIVVVLVAVMLNRRGAVEEDKLSDQQAGSKTSAAGKTSCASQATYDRIKSELFHQAAQVRKNDTSAFDRLAAYASVRVERPLLRSRDTELGTVRCTGRLSLDLPPGVSVVGGRRTLSADIDYVLQPAADGSGDVVMLEGADPIVTPLATLARTGQSSPLPGTPTNPPSELPPLGTPQDQALPASPPQTVPQAPPVAPEPVASGAARPSFNCRYARTRGEIAVCNDAGLAALDRQMAAEFYRALASGGPRERQLLRSTRDSFLRYRDRCPNDNCVAETYRGRIREIRDIMRGSWRPER